MSDDLVDRLRAQADYTERFWFPAHPSSKLLREAASEIERLRRIGEPARFKAAHPSGESEPDGDTGLGAGSPMRL